MTFPMTLDRLHRISSALVLGLLLVVTVGMGALLGLVGDGGVVVGALGLGAGWLALALAWALAPVGLQLRGSELRVLRRAWRAAVIPLADIVEATPGSFPAGALRVMGTGGFFGSYGLFYARSLGLFRAWATRGDRAVKLARVAGRPVVVTPDEPERFAEALRSWQAAARAVH